MKCDIRFDSVMPPGSSKCFTCGREFLAPGPQGAMEDCYRELGSQLIEARRWIASLMTHMEDNWRAIDSGPIERAREYLMRTAVNGDER